MKIVAVTNEYLEIVFIEGSDKGFWRMGIPGRLVDLKMDQGLKELWYEYLPNGLKLVSELDRVNELNAAYAKFKLTTEGSTK